MIKKYNKIALIYGQSTKDIATQFESKINELNKKNADGIWYPIEAIMCDDFAFRQTESDRNISDTVKTKFDNVVHAFVFLGSDDFALPLEDNMRANSLNDVKQKFTEVAFSKTKELSSDMFNSKFDNFKLRASQNVILETGLIWGQMGDFNNITFISLIPFSELKTQNYSLPSDVPIAAKYVISLEMDKTLETKISQIINDKLIVGGLKILPYKNLYNDENYVVDYKNFFTTKQLLEINGQKLTDTDRKNKLTHSEPFDYIVKLWDKDIKSLKYDEEKIIYIFERLVFVSYFHRDKQEGLKWASKALNSINGTVKASDYYKILQQVLEYIKTRGAGSAGYIIYKEIADELLAIKAQLSKEKLNPVIEVYLNDYIGLSCRWVVQQFENDKSVDSQFDYIKYLNHSLSALTCCVDLEFNSAYEAAILWRGYSLLNRARTNHFLYKYTRDNNYKLQSDRDFQKAFETREEWLTLDALGAMPKVFENSFISEFVMATLNAKDAGIFNDSQWTEIEDKLEDCYRKLTLASSVGLNLVSYAKDMLEKSSIGIDGKVKQIVKNMLADNMPIDNIRKYTGLSINKIKSLNN
jgi:hypothetical protein